MDEQQLHDLKYPIGQFTTPEKIDEDMIGSWIADIASFPERLSKTVSSLSDQQLNTPYRPDGWTIRQVVHHCADSHMNSLIRFKLTLTEDKPVIKPYFEDRWANLPDSNMDITPALQLLQGLHIKWVFLLQSLTSAELKKSFIHPDHQEPISLDIAIALYAWHCNHHLAHITGSISRNNRG